MNRKDEQAQGSELSDGLGGAHYTTGYLHNCFLMSHEKQEGPMFRLGGPPERYLTAHLDGYAIIPLAEYERLKALDA